MKIIRQSAQFCIGGGAYVGLELLYRGRSHISMFCTGGICYLLLGQLSRQRIPPAAKAAYGAAIVTAAELTAGLLVNRDYHVWDYRDQPLNLLGQICPAFSLVWVPISGAAMALYQYADRKLGRLT